MNTNKKDTNQLHTKNFFYPPGGILIWFIIVIELLTFGGAFLFYFLDRSENLEVFKKSQDLLNRDLATINTLFLITSGYFVANAVSYYKNLLPKKSVEQLILGSIFGLFFVSTKVFEYNGKISSGHVIGTNSFFDFYWLLTGFHLIHVVFGIGLLLCGCILIKKNHKPIEGDPPPIEIFASFWHLCDIIWIFLFPVLYLI